METLEFTKYKWSVVCILLGTLLVVYSVSSVHQWRITQHQLIKDQEELGKISIVGEKPEMPVLQEEDKKQSNIVLNQVQEPQKIKREDYGRGNMVIRIPKINVEAAVMEGTTVEMLKKGPGLYEISPLPTDVEGNVCIAGHRTTYGAWFRHVDQLSEGDEILLEFQDKTYHYKTERVFIIAKNDWTVTQPTGYAVLTLTACHPLRSSKQRIVVRAKLDRILDKNNV